MPNSRSFGFAVGISAAALLAGCAGGGSPSNGVTPGALPEAASVQRAAGFGAFNTFVARVAAKAVHPSVGRSWPATNQRGARFFVSDAGDETVDLFGYKSLKQLDQITGLSEPQGMCSHRKTAWLANTGGSDFIHFNAAGKVIGILPDPGQFPVGCAVDKHGDLAGANIISTNSGPGSVSIWAGGHGSPTNYPITGMARVYFLAYDPDGNLFADGSSASGVFELAELAKGASAFVPLTVDGATINFPGSLQYAYGALALVDQSGSAGHSVVYQAHVSGKVATIVSKTELNDALDAVGSCITPFGTIIVADAADLDVQIYAYPGGGNPLHTIQPGFGQPIGCAFTP
jgi:hypothetical protein